MVGAVRTPEDDWISEWVSTWGDQVVRFLAAYTGDQEQAQDLAQDTFIKIYRWRMTHPHRVVHPGLLFRTAQNLARDRWRKEERERRALVLSREDEAFESPDSTLMVRDVLDHLAAPDRECLLLFYWGDQSTPDIARWLGVSPITVRVRLARAREKFRRLWQSEEGDS
ncbi:MAG: RNA polymerase sigma factor [Clostridia bacterium]